MIKIIILTWIFTGIISHLLCYAAWRYIKKNKELYKKYMVSVNGNRPIKDWVDPMAETSTLIITLSAFIFMGYFSVIYLVRTIFKK